VDVEVEVVEVDVQVDVVVVDGVVVVHGVLECVEDGLEGVAEAVLVDVSVLQVDVDGHDPDVLVPLAVGDEDHEPEGYVGHVLVDETLVSTVDADEPCVGHVGRIPP
jgi:hypothetical protein